MSTRRPGPGWLLPGAAALGMLAGCTAATGPAPTAAAHSASPSVRPTVSTARVSISPATTAHTVRLDAPIRVTAGGGRLRTVTVTAGKAAVSGRLNPAGTVWTTVRPLRAATRYVVRATAVDVHDLAVSSSSTFRTLRPARTVKAYMAPLAGETVGVGMPVAITFTAPVTNRAAVQRVLTVTTTHDVPGAWRWLSNTEVHYRPQRYWPVGEKVTVDIGLLGVDAGKGVWGAQSRHIRFDVGDAHVSRVDAQRHSMTVASNGKVVRTFPVSTGRAKYPTSSGVHLVSEKVADKVMDSATVGIPRDSADGYYEHVAWSTRISNSGEFVHAAPWSVGSQGRANVSHGCVNASTSDARWFYEFSLRGDIVSVTGTPKGLAPGNGFTDWNVSWKAWTSGQGYV